jgi:hypothetical protein
MLPVAEVIDRSFSRQHDFGLMIQLWCWYAFPYGVQLLAWFLGSALFPRRRAAIQSKFIELVAILDQSREPFWAQPAAGPGLPAWPLVFGRELSACPCVKPRIIFWSGKVEALSLESMKLPLEFSGLFADQNSEFGA